MTTKQQEREALQKIREIVEALGEDSYIGTAFEGVFETAEDNIENDFACSLAQQVRSFKDMSAKLTALNKEHTATIEKLRKENVLLAGRLHGCMEEHKRVEQKDPEIMKLKARLYDLMTKEEA